MGVPTIERTDLTDGAETAEPEDIAMNAHCFTTPAGERLVILSEADYAMLIEAAEDAADSRPSRGSAGSSRLGKRN